MIYCPPLRSFGGFFMETVDYIIVGFGIAGASFCERLLQGKKTFVVFDTAKGSASRIAGGTINPVVLKRFTPVWKVDAFFTESLSFYESLQAKSPFEFCKRNKILRIFNNTEEQNEWSVASNSVKLSKYMNPAIRPMENKEVRAPFQCGEVDPVLQLDTVALLNGLKSQLMPLGIFHEEEFEYNKIVVEDGNIHYKGITSKKIVFADGTKALENPYFPKEALIAKKGEYLIVKANGLQLKEILKGPYFFIPLGNDLYKVGATFVHGDNRVETTEKSKQQLVEALQKMISCLFEIVDQQVGMRPTVKDRRPLLGSFKDENVVFYNGLGTRGLLMAPLLSKMLWDHLEKGTPLPEEVAIKRFSSYRT